jgi:hypothetical protein
MLTYGSNNTEKYFQNYLSPFMYDCVTSVASLSELSLEILKGQNQTFQIIALTENNLLLNQKLQDAKKIFYMWHDTAKGWFTSSYWATNFVYIEKKFLEWITLTANPKCSKIDLKIKKLNIFISFVEKSLNENLTWYYDPQYVYSIINYAIADSGIKGITNC